MSSILKNPIRKDFGRTSIYLAKQGANIAIWYIGLIRLSRKCGKNKKFLLKVKAIVIVFLWLQFNKY
jgi:hypothetical protein